MRKDLMLGLIFMILIVSSSLVSADPILDVLNEYYEADMNEDIDKMIKLTDFTVVEKDERKQFQEDTRTIMTALAEVYDTVSYDISEEIVFENDDEAMVIYKLNAEIKDRNGDNAVINTYYIGVMHKSNKWKITFTQPKAIYEQNMLMMDVVDTAATNLENTNLQPILDELKIEGPSCFGEVCIEETPPIRPVKKGIIARIIEWLINLFSSESEEGIDSNRLEDTPKQDEKSDIPADKITAREATQAYSDYIEAYNKLTKLQSEGKGDTPEARQAYSEYKKKKEIYETYGALAKKK